MIRTEVHHDCGYNLIKIAAPEQYNITSLSDVPAHLKGISFDRLPSTYHKFINTGRYFLTWHDPDSQQFVSFCPQCGGPLAYDERVTK